MASISKAQRVALNKMNSTSYQQEMGKLIDNSMGCVRGTYDFSIHGGAIGDYNMYSQDSDMVATGSAALGNQAVKLPSGVIVIGGFVHVITAFTSGGSATMDFQIVGANDLLAGSAVAGFTAGANLQLIPDFATVADYVRTTTTSTLTMSVNTAALTAGKCNIFLFYVQRI